MSAGEKAKAKETPEPFVDTRLEGKILLKNVEDEVFDIVYKWLEYHEKLPPKKLPDTLPSSNLKV